MSKNTEVIVDEKQGLPNYSSRRVSVTVIADEGESLNISQVIVETTRLIRAGWDMIWKGTSAPKSYEAQEKEITKEVLTETVKESKQIPGAGKAVKAVRTRRPKDEKKLKASDVMRPEVDDVDDDDSLDV